MLERTHVTRRPCFDVLELCLGRSAGHMLLANCSALDSLSLHFLSKKPLLEIRGLACQLRMLSRMGQIWSSAFSFTFHEIQHEKIHNTEYKIQNTKYRIQNTEYKIWTYNIQGLACQLRALSRMGQIWGSAFPFTRNHFPHVNVLHLATWT